MDHLARSVPPPLLQPSASIHEEQTHDTFKAILSLQSITESQWNQCTMREKYGSFGLTSVKDVASVAYLASWAHSAATLPKWFPTLWGSPEFLINNMNNIFKSHWTMP